MAKIYLASISSRRKEVLKGLGVKFNVLVPKVYEPNFQYFNMFKGGFKFIPPKTKVATVRLRRVSLRDKVKRNLKVAATTYHSFRRLKPIEFALTLAKMKVESVQNRARDGIIIGMDTIVVLGKMILGKPKNRKEAKRMINILAGKTHNVITGIYLLRLPDKKTAKGYELTRVKFRKLTTLEIEQYIKTKEPYDKAGAYGIQGKAGLFVESINGCYFNVVGFPVAKFLKLFNRLMQF
jgi:septum formation protein